MYYKIQPDEYGTLIGGADDCNAKAQELKISLEKAGIPQITLDLAFIKKARTFIILLSPGTKSNPRLVDAAYRNAGN